MQLNQVVDGAVNLTLSENETLLVSNALNEVCSRISAGDFHPRLGVHLDDARAFCEKFRKAARLIGPTKIDAQSDQIVGVAVNVTLAKREVILVSNALNEVCNGLFVAEFPVRLGASLNDANALHEEFRKALRSM